MMRRPYNSFANLSVIHSFPIVDRLICFIKEYVKFRRPDNMNIFAMVIHTSLRHFLMYFSRHKISVHRIVKFKIHNFRMICNVITIGGIKRKFIPELINIEILLKLRQPILSIKQNIWIQFPSQIQDRKSVV